MAWSASPISVTLPSVADPHLSRAKKRLSTTLRRRRIELRLTQEEAASVIGMDGRHYQKLELGELNPTLRTLIRVAIGLEMDPSDLLG